MIRVEVKPGLLRWARERAGLTQEQLQRQSKFKQLPHWETGEKQPTLKQIESFARAVHVPVGYLFLSEPPEESIPIADFRTVAGRTLTRPSPNLLDTIYACQERQSWYREFALVTGQPEISFIQSATTNTSAQTVAAQMREALNYQVDDRRECSGWTEALRLFISQADDAGVLVMVNGVVNSNTHRRLDPNEFRGFALSDPFAPLVFINGADTKAAQMFTLAHELAHLWLGVSALSDIGAKPPRSSQQEEIWCNAVAAEFLVPLDDLSSKLRRSEPLPEAMTRLAKTYKVSTLVILRRLLDVEFIDRETFDKEWNEELTCLVQLSQRGQSGGNFYRTTITRTGQRFTRALVVSVLEGQTLYRDALRMLGIPKVTTFNELSKKLDVSS